MKKLLLLLLPLLFASYANAQTEASTVPATLPFLKTDADVEKASALLKTGVANDILTNAYKIAIKNIFGNKKEASYSSTIYGTIRLFNPHFGSGASYQDTRWARNIEWTVAGKVDSNSNIAGFGGTVKISLLNKRDLTVRNGELATKMKDYVHHYQRDIDSARDIIESDIKKKFKERKDSMINEKTDAVKSKLTQIQANEEADAIKSKLTQIQASKRKYGKSFDPIDLDPDLVKVLNSINSPITAGKGMAAEAVAYFNNKVNEIKNKPLWTLSGTYFHVPYSKNDTTTIKSDFVMGLSSDKDNGFWELNASAYANFFDNGALGSAKKYHVEGGFNRVLAQETNGKSNMELKAFLSYDKGINTPGFPTATTANLTYRYLVDKFGGFWIPITLSYNPNGGRFLGLIDLTINIDPKN